MDMSGTGVATCCWDVVLNGAFPEWAAERLEKKLQYLVALCKENRRTSEHVQVGTQGPRYLSLWVTGGGFFGDGRGRGA